MGQGADTGRVAERETQALARSICVLVDSGLTAPSLAQTTDTLKNTLPTECQIWQGITKVKASKIYIGSKKVIHLRFPHQQIKHNSLNVELVIQQSYICCS